MYDRIEKLAEKFEQAALAAVKKTAATFEGRVAQMFKEEHRQVAGHEPSDVRVRAEFSRDENGDPSYPGSVTIWSDSYQPEYRITLENRMMQRLDPKREGLYDEVSVIFFDPETGAES